MGAVQPAGVWLVQPVPQVVAAAGAAKSRSANRRMYTVHSSALGAVAGTGHTLGAWCEQDGQLRETRDGPKPIG